MPPRSITDDEVFRAADAISALGRNPGPTEIRRMLGDRGGYTLISRILERWSQQRAQQPGHADSLVPDVITNCGTALVREVWRTAVGQAQERTTEIEQIARRRVEAAEQVQAEAENEVQRLEQINEALLQQLDESQLQNSELRQELENVRGTLRAHQARIEEQERRINDLLQALDRDVHVQQRLEKQIERMQSEFVEQSLRSAAQMGQLIESLSERLQASSGTTSGATGEQAKQVGET